MGCDIHTMAEIQWGDGEWVAIKDPIFPNAYFNPLKRVSPVNKPFIEEPYIERNYQVFALLANVRNYGNVVPLAMPRGVPDDSSREWKAYIDEWGSVLHSLTYFTLDELGSPANWEEYSPAFAKTVDVLKHSVREFYKDFYKDSVRDVRLMIGFDN